MHTFASETALVKVEGKIDGTKTGNPRRQYLPVCGRLEMEAEMGVTSDPGT